MSLSFTTGYEIRYALRSAGERQRRLQSRRRATGGRRSYSRCPTPVTGPLPPPPHRRFHIHSVITVHAIKSPGTPHNALRYDVVMAAAAAAAAVGISFVPRRVYSLHTPPPPGPPRIRSGWKTLTRSVAHSVSDLQRKYILYTVLIVFCYFFFFLLFCCFSLNNIIAFPFSYAAGPPQRRSPKREYFSLTRVCVEQYLGTRDRGCFVFF